MGLARYGQPTYRDVIYRHLINLRPDGSLWLNMEYFNYCQGLTMTNRRLTTFLADRHESQARLSNLGTWIWHQHPIGH